MHDAGRQIWEIRVPKDIELTPLKNRNEQEKNKDNKKEPREMKKWKEWEMNERTMKNDHPKTQFGPTYPFFWNHKP